MKLHPRMAYFLQYRISLTSAPPCLQVPWPRTWNVFVLGPGKSQTYKVFFQFHERDRLMRLTRLAIYNDTNCLRLHVILSDQRRVKSYQNSPLGCSSFDAWLILNPSKSLPAPIAYSIILSSNRIEVQGRLILSWCWHFWQKNENRDDLIVVVSCYGYF